MNKTWRYKIAWPIWGTSRFLECSGEEGGCKDKSGEVSRARQLCTMLWGRAIGLSPIGAREASQLGCALHRLRDCIPGVT